MKNLAVRDACARVRLLPPGKTKLPFFGPTKKYPWIGYAVFWEEMTEEERDKLYEVYQEEGLDVLQDTVKFLDDSVWLSRRLRKKEASIRRGRRIMEGR